ncbi:carbon storage regulator CsrA [bacterium]|nr:carbon storage regulator CsrA [bacterium]
MLILTRKNNESIIIGDNIEISVVEISQTSVRLGIKAPASIPVHRKEIYDTIQKENIIASMSEFIDISKLGGELLKLKSEKKV